MRGLRLFCIGEGDTFRFAMCASKQDACAKLGAEARMPDPDDLRRIWLDEKLYEMSPAQIQERFGVSRQAVSIWRRKAGSDLPRLTDHRREQRHARIRELLDPAKSAREIAEAVGTTNVEVYEVAAAAGVTLAVKNKKKPSDEEIVALAEGRTWRQLAEACNVTLATLRNYVYARADLSEQVCSRLEHEPTGEPAHGRIDVDELVRLYEGGVTPFKIAEHFGTQPMSIIYWLKKLEIYRGKDAR